MRSAPVTEPQRWVVAQAACTAAYLARSGLARRRVKVRWWSEAARRGPDVVGALARLWAATGPRRAGTAVVVAVYEPSAEAGAIPFLVVRAAESGLARPAGRAVATLYGDPVPGGALVVETWAGTVVPAEPPTAAGRDALPWSDVDPPA